MTVSCGDAARDALRSIPSVNDMLSRQEIRAAVSELSHPVVVELLRQEISQIRAEILSGIEAHGERRSDRHGERRSDRHGDPRADQHVDRGAEGGVDPGADGHINPGADGHIDRSLIEERLVASVLRSLQGSRGLHLRKVINATGIILHTNLGRAPLPSVAISAIEGVAQGYSNLEFDLNSGERGSRQAQLRSILSQLTGAESALVVNNNAAAVFLCLNTLASDGEVVVSRGEQVEIGGSFRIPDVIRQSGATMVEVGCTNKTHIRDYEDAITPETRVLLKVHTSNYRVVGFVESVDLPSLARLGHERNLIVMEDVGSGCLVDLSLLGLPKEPTVLDSIRAGVDLVTFSGDKLLGGPQAGIIVGRRDLVDRVSRNPLARAVRVDKMTLAALEATLRLYTNPSQARREIPILRMMGESIDSLRQRADRLASRLSDLNCVALGERSEAGSDSAGQFIIRVVDDLCEVGGGALPGVEFPGVAVEISPCGDGATAVSPRQDGDRVISRRDDGGSLISRRQCGEKAISVTELHRRFMAAAVPVVGRVVQGSLLLNLRTIQPDDEDAVVASFIEVLGR